MAFLASQGSAKMPRGLPGLPRGASLYGGPRRFDFAQGPEPLDRARDPELVERACRRALLWPRLNIFFDSLVSV